MSHTQSKTGLDYLRQTGAIASHQNIHKVNAVDANVSVYSDSDRFEKLVNLDFRFDKVFTRHQIEEKYAYNLRM